MRKGQPAQYIARLSSNCWLLISRVINAWPDTEVQVETMELTPAYTETEQECYFQYQVEAGPEGETGETFTGEMALSFIDEEWKVDSLS